MVLCRLHAYRKNQILLLSCNLNHESPFLDKHVYHALMYVYMNRSTNVDIVYAGDIWGNMKIYSLIFQKKKNI